MHRWPGAAWIVPTSMVLLAFGCGRTDVSLVTQSLPGTETGFATDSTGSTTEDGDTTETDPMPDMGGPSFCGDGVQDPNEQCDPGEDLIGPGQFCLDDCFDNVCGDGDQSPDEQCDDGNDDETDGCRSDCILSSCGDGNPQPGEECDDGNNSDNDACLNDCTQASCGDGFVFDGLEQCDEGDDNQPFGECTPNCTNNVCGDGFQRFDEECDPGADNIGPGLECRDGCVLNVCGDGDPWAQEACDDGNNNNEDACVNCAPAQCGDGFVFADNEECDDGNNNDFDACRDSCNFHRVTKMSLGGNHTCALFDSRRIQCWGNGNNGRTGHGNELNIGDNEPASQAGFLTITGSDIVTGLSHTCVTTPDLGGDLYTCFGRGLEGQLGYGNIDDLGDDETPDAIPFLTMAAFGSVIGTRGGAFHSCRAEIDGAVRCWGSQNFFQLGIPGLAEAIGDDEPSSAATAVDLGPGTVAEIAAGVRHTCVRFDDGRVRCWGEASDGALGYGNTNDIGDDESPTQDVPIGASAAQLTVGFFHTCVITTDDEVRCWGRGANGRLGYGNTVSVGVAQTPADVGSVDVGDGIPVQIEAAANHTCVLMDDGAVRCWGVGDQGQLGYGNTAAIGDNEPPSVAGNVPVGAPASSIAADGNHTCAILSETGAVRCWGQGGDGRLGYGNVATIGDNEFPASVGDVPLFP